MLVRSAYEQERAHLAGRTRSIRPTGFREIYRVRRRVAKPDNAVNNPNSASKAGCSAGTDNATTGGTSNRALTVCATLIVTLQVPVPEQPAPLHPVNIEPAAGVAVSVTAAFCGMATVHAAAQLPSSLLMATMPLLLPDRVMVRATVGAMSNCALTVRAAVMETVHVSAVPLQPPPLHPAKVDM